MKVLGTHRNFTTTFTKKFDTANVGDAEYVLLNECKPDVIIHCGALTNVDECETNPKKSYEETVHSAINVVKIATQFKSKIIYISTDYVFNGESGPYKETDYVAPINTYGKHKLEAEELIISHSINNLILRVTNVYGEELRGKNFISRLLKAPTEKTTLNLPIDQFATPINAADIAKAIYYLLIDKKQGVYHLGSTDYYNRYQLANKVIALTKKSNKWIFQPVTTTALQQLAKRPLLGGLICAKFLSEYPNFQFSNIDNYILNLQ